MFAQRFAGSPRDKYFNSLYIKKCMAKVFFSTSEKTIWREIIAFSSLCYQKWIWIMLIQGKRKFLFELP